MTLNKMEPGETTPFPAHPHIYKTNDVVIIGAGDHAAIVIDILESVGYYDIVGVTSDDPNNVSKKIKYPLLGTNEILELKSLKKQGVCSVAVGVGGWVDNKVRKKMYVRLKELEFACISNIHPSAVISKYSTIGEGCTIFPGVIINCGVTIGDNVIVATGSTIDHDTIIQDHALISAGVNIGGNVIVGEGATVSIGATVVSGIKIGVECLIAAGAVVINNIPDNTTVYGIPARPKNYIDRNTEECVDYEVSLHITEKL